MMDGGTMAGYSFMGWGMWLALSMNFLLILLFFGLFFMLVLAVERIE